MPIQNINGKEIAVLTYGYSDKYWPLLSEYVKAMHGKNEVKDPAEVQACLKGCFKLLGDSFMALVNSQKKASFYIFVQYLHENSIDIYTEQLKGYKIPINESDFAVSRRVLKIIFEQSVTVDLLDMMTSSLKSKRTKRDSRNYWKIYFISAAGQSE